VRVALIHDWLTGLRGGERVLDEIAGMFPDADLYTLVHAPGSTTPRIDDRRIVTSPLSAWPGARRHYRKMLPLMPWAARRLGVRGYDLVVSTSHAFAKSATIETGTPHLCYCFTPLRYVWDQVDAYLGRGPRRWAALPFVHGLRRFDRRRSGPDQVTRFVAISRNVARRIEQHYGRTAPVVHPPVDVDRIRPDGAAPDDFYLLVGGFVPYKAEHVALEAFRRLGRPLVVAGDGPGRERLAAGSPPNVVFTGRLADAELAQLYARCRALVYPQEEDFGIVAVEAQAAGRPVVALGRGGAAETVLPLDRPVPLHGARDLGPTGVWFDEQTPDALVRAIERFERAESRFDAGRIRSWAERFHPRHFRSGLAAQIAQTLRRPADRPPAAAGAAP
jgi:glycosyltransferase involved in cell wall biosynthesis